MEPMTYSTYAFYIDRLGKDAGFEVNELLLSPRNCNAVDGMYFLIFLSNSLG